MLLARPYWMGEPHAGKGVTTDALKCLIPNVFDQDAVAPDRAACIPTIKEVSASLKRPVFGVRGYLSRLSENQRRLARFTCFTPLDAEDWQSMRAQRSGSGGDMHFP